MSDLVCLAHLDWNHVWQRPQHLLTRAAQRHRVFYVEEPREKDVERASMSERAAENGVRVCTPTLPKRLSARSFDHAVTGLLQALAIRHRLSAAVAWYTTPAWVRWSAPLDSALEVYDCMDDLASFRKAAADLPRFEARLLERADLVFTGGRSLYLSRRTRHPSVHLFPSSVEREHFASARLPGRVPAALARVPRPRAIYTAVLDERLDTELLAAVARLAPEISWVLVGPVAKIKRSALPAAPNIHRLGKQPYRVLPDLLRGADVAIMPFALNASTRHISPTKSLEYLAAGLPVVSTPVPDVVATFRGTGLVRIAADPAAFVGAVREMMTLAREAFAERCDDFLAHNSWDATWARMEALCLNAMSRRLAASQAPVAAGASA